MLAVGVAGGTREFTGIYALRWHCPTQPEDRSEQTKSEI